jgi:3-oxoacyl-(acyl-carrier-protein) synthase
MYEVFIANYNSNGTSEGISYPSPSGQEAVIRQAYSSAGGLDPALTGYFEAHGTGTPVGDPIEVSAIGRVFAEHRDDQHPLLIGSIKPNLGHSESASAIASIMKAVMAIEKGEIPPTRGITKFNPGIDFEKSRTKVVQEMTPWPMLPIRRASVNSFGYGGANGEYSCLTTSKLYFSQNFSPRYLGPRRKCASWIQRANLETFGSFGIASFAIRPTRSFHIIDIFACDFRKP